MKAWFQILMGSVLLLGGCHPKPSPIPPKNDTPPLKATIKYLALGDSYTIGESVTQAESFPYELSRRWQEDTLLIPIEVSTNVIAKTGWTTTNLKQAIRNTELTQDYDWVSLLIGVNNQYQHKPLALYETEFRELLTTAIALAGNDTAHVFVLSIPDYGATPFGANNAQQISAEIDIYNSVNEKICKEFHVKRFNITPISRNAKTDPSLLAYDQLHPSGKMYAQWVDLLYETITKERYKQGK